MLERSLAMRAVRREAEALPARFGGCVMCGLVAHAPETHVLSKSRRSIAVLARYGVRRGHVLVVMRRHVERFEDVSWPDWEDAQRLAWEAARAVESALDATRVYVAALGSVVQRPMTFPHQHLHVVPTYRGDRRDRPARVFTWAEGVVVHDGDEAEELAEAIRAAWPRSRIRSHRRIAPGDSSFRASRDTRSAPSPRPR